MTDDADRIIEVYERHADAFANARDRSLFERSWLDAFLGLLPERASILDLGCGFGSPLGAYLLDKGHEVTGVDSSDALIARARAELPEGRWIVGDMRSLDLGETFDGILAWNSSFHLSQADQRAFFPVVARHAGPSAAFLFTSGPEAGERIGEMHGDRLFHASLAPEEYRDLLIGHGFETVRYTAEDPECRGHSVWLARRQAA